MSVNLRDKLRQYIALNNYVSAYRSNVVAGQELNNSELNLTDAIHDRLEDLTLYGASKTVSTEYLDTVNANGNSLMQGRDLPIEYTQVEYAKKKGTAGVQGKFDTGIKPTADDVKIEIKVKIGDEAQQAGQSTVGSFYACQARATATSEITGISGSSSGATILGLQNGQSVASGIVRVKDHIDIISYEYKNGTHSIYVKDLTTNTEDTQTGTYTFAAPTKNLYIFGNTTATNNLNNNNAIYYCKIWVSGSLAFDAVPVIRNSDNKVGLYDKVSERFIEPIITEGGGFEAGDAATPTPDNPMDIYDNNGILTPYLDAEGSSSQARIPTPTAPIDMINYKQGLVELRGIGTVKDILTHGPINATITRNVGVRVFDGTEDFALVSGNTDIFRTPNNAVYPSDFASNPNSNVGLCNNYKIVSTSTSLASNIQDGEMGWNTNGALTVRDSRFTTAAQFKAWLAQMYIEGTPVVLYYPLATATTESILPAYGAQITRDYEQLEYITTNGDAYIQTDITGADIRWTGSGKSNNLSYNSSQCILSCKVNTGYSFGAVYFIGPQVTTTQKWAIQTGTGTSTVPTSDYAEYDVMFTSSAKSYGRINNDYVTYSNGSSTWTYYEWYIGYAFGSSRNYVYYGNIYEQKAYKNGVLVGDFIPARRKSDGVIGMYDAVSGTFYTNAGTGDFTAGPSMYRNLANVATDIDGKYIAEDGSIGTSATSCYSAIIPVVAGETYVWSCTCGNSGQKNNKRVHAYIDGVWNQQIFLEEVSAGVAWSKSFTIPAGCNGIRISHWNTDTDTQVELGSTKTSYVPYKIQKYIISVKPETLQDVRNYTATCQDLLYVNNTRDTQEIITGVTTRNCGILVLDGTESWAAHPSLTGWFYLSNSIFPSLTTPIICSHYPYNSNYSYSGQFASCGTTTGTTARIIIADNVNFQTTSVVTAFKSWLAEQYAAGTPVIVVYPLETPTTETVDAQLLKKAPVEITHVALADSTVDTTNATVSEASPDYPLDIACNNGIIGVVDKSDWTTVIGGSGAGTAMYIIPDTGKWSYVSSSSDQGSGFIIPIKIGKTYTLVSKNPSGSNSTILRYGQYSDGIMPTSSQSGSNGKQLIKWNAYSSGNVNKSITFRAEQPYLIIQISYANMTASNGGINTISLIESNASSTEYEELEYVEGTTTGSSGSYIDTLIKPNSNTKVEVQFSVNELGTNQCVIGSRNAASGTSKNGFAIWGSASNKIRFDYQSAPPPFIEYSNSANTIHTVIKDKEKNYVDGVQQDSNTIENFKTDYSMLLFAINSGTSGRQSCLSGKIYYCKIWDNDILVRDFIPVKRISDNAIGMYDRVSKTFFANLGSGDFVGGPSKGILQNTETTYVNSKNLYDYSTTTLDYEIQADGTIAVKSGYCYSDIIPVVEGNTYTFSMEKSNAQTIRIHGYIDDTWNQQITSKTTSSNSAAYITFTIPAGINGIRISQNKANTYVQVEEGPRPTQYEVYGRDIVKPLNLLSAGSYMDVQNVSTGITTHKIGVMVFDGTEAWMTFPSGSSNCPARLVIKDMQTVSNDVVAPVVCSHFIPGVWEDMTPALRKTPYIVVSDLPTNPYIALTVEWNPAITSVDVWKSWLKEQYNKGTPVILVYPLATGYTETNTPQDVVLTSSNSKIERDSEYINNLGIGVNYKKLK